MRRFSIRARLTATFLLLISMALVEAAIVLYVQRESSAALDETSRAHSVLLNEATMRASLRAMQGALRGYVLMVADDELAIYQGAHTRYDTLARETPGLLRDPAQAARFDRIVALAARWQEAATQVIAETQRGRDPSTTMNALALPRFAQLERELDAFVERQQVLHRIADEAARDRIRTATVVLTAIPGAAVVFMFGGLLAGRRALRPLGSLVESALRLARGDYTAPLPRTGEHEIGALVAAFAHMRTAVQERATEAAAAQQRAHKAHTELLGVLDTAPAGLVVLDVHGAVRLRNRAAERLLGTPPPGQEERAFWQTFAVRDSSGRPLRIRDLPPARALAGTEVVGEELEVRRPDGRRIDVLVGAVPLRDTEARVIGAVAGFQDITRLRELDRLKDEFVAIVSHELRTPLTAIRGALQLLLAEDAAPAADHRELLAVASHSCERLVRIVNDMLDLSKIEAGQLQLRLAPQMVPTLVRQAVDAVQALAASAGLTIAADIPGDLPPVRADADRLTQALVNLLSNALKFAPRGSTVSVRAARTDRVIALSVADRGPGIAAADLSRLFQKFQQLDGAGTRRTGGTGLGLVITKAIVEEHGGTIAVDSVVGRGTTFTLTVPVYVEESPAAEVSRPAALTGGDARPRVLVIDDRDGNRTRITQALEAAGMSPIVAGTGPDAAEAARRAQPVAILLSAAGGGDARLVEDLTRGAATRQIPIIITLADEDLGPPDPVAIEAAAGDLVARVRRALDDHPHGTVLVADDDLDTRIVLRRILERHGFRVVEASNGIEALERARTHRPDLVLLDLRMPGLHGHDVIRTLRSGAATASLPILVLSGSVGERQSLYALVLGANAFLAKPADPAALVAEIERLVRRERTA